MRIPRFILGMFSVAMLILGANAASGQTFPSKPVRIVTSEPGGSGDLLGRLIAQGLTGGLGQPVIVENRGGSVVIPSLIVAKASPDGYTLLLYGGTFWVGPLLESMPYDPVKDFSPVTLAVGSPGIVVVHPSLPVNSVKELIALAKAKPGALNYGSGATGAITHLAVELFKVMAGVNVVRIPYKGAGPAINALIGGQVQFMFATSGSVASHVKSGKLKALAVTSAQPSRLFPDLPTVAATVPGYRGESIFGLFAPAKTPAAIIRRLNQEIVRVLNSTDVKEKLFTSGIEVVASSPEEFGAALKTEIARLRKVIQDAGIKAE